MDEKPDTPSAVAAVIGVSPWSVPWVTMWKIGPECAALIRHYGCGASLFGKAAKFRQVVRRSETPKHQVICIGDEARDIEAAVKAGLAAAAVTWGYATAALLERYQPAMMFSAMAEIPERLGHAARPGI